MKQQSDHLAGAGSDQSTEKEGAAVERAARLDRALREIDTKCTNMIRTRSRDIEDWIDDAFAIKTILGEALLRTAPPPSPKERSGD